MATNRKVTTTMTKTATPSDELVELFISVAAYHEIDLGRANPATAYAKAATELRYPGHLKRGDKRPPDTYATHNMVLRALGTHAKRAGLEVPDGARCEGADHCRRLRIPGFGSCHWHGASVTPDDEILATMRAEIGLN